MDFALDLLEGHVSVLPVWHLKRLHKVEDYLDLTVVLFNVV